MLCQVSEVERNNLAALVAVVGSRICVPIFLTVEFCLMELLICRVCYHSIGTTTRALRRGLTALLSVVLSLLIKDMQFMYLQQLLRKAGVAAYLCLHIFWLYSGRFSKNKMEERDEIRCSHE